MFPRIAVITADVPVAGDRVAWGMYHVNARLLKALEPYLGIIFVSDASWDDIDPKLRAKSVCVNSPFIFKVVRKLVGIIFGSSMRNFGFRFILPALARRVKEAKCAWIFCPCGANPFDLERAVLLARAAHLPLAVYLVDDLVESARLSGNREHLAVALRDVPGWIRQADKIFVISEGFRERVRTLYDREAMIMPLPYELSTMPANKVFAASEEQIIFVGNLSHFYVNGLKAMAAVLDDLNAKEDLRLTLRFTLPVMEQVKRMIGDFKCIRCLPCPGLDDLRGEIAASLMAFVPYSFDPQHQVMTSTSFPSKMLSCLASARHIFVMGPENSSSVRYFKQHGLPEVLATGDAGHLREAVLRQWRDKADHGVLYRKIVGQEHASEKIAGKFLAALNDTELLPRAVATAASNKYFPWLLNLIGSIQRNYPDHPPIFVYDLGLRDCFIEELKIIRGVIVRKVDSFVPHWRKCYTWKPWVMDDVPARDVYYIDAGAEVLRPLTGIFETIARDGYFCHSQASWGYSLADITPPELLRHLGLDNNFALGRDYFCAGIMGYRKQTVYHACIREALELAREGWAMGWSPAEKSRDKGADICGIVRDCRLFRHDQTLLNVVFQARCPDLVLHAEDDFSYEKKNNASQLIWHPRRSNRTLEYVRQVCYAGPWPWHRSVKRNFFVGIDRLVSALQRFINIGTL